MRVVVEHRCRRLDLSPVERLVPALLQEWTGLEFGPDGRARRPGVAADDRLRLTSGRHDHPGATYVVEVPGDDGVVRDRQQVRLDASSASGDRRELTVAPVPGSEQPGTPGWTARARLADLPRGPLEKPRLPTVSGDLDLDLRPVARHPGMPPLVGPLALRLVGSALRVEGEVRPATLSGTSAAARPLVRASGRCGGWHADLAVDVAAGEEWEATVALDLSARGPGRVVLALVGRRRVERWLRQALDSVAGPEAIDEEERGLLRTERETARAGGPGPYVRHLLRGDGRAVVGGAT